jgi:hypothetical protein
MKEDWMVTRRGMLKGAAGTAALSLPIVSRFSNVAAQDASPEAGGPPLPEGCELIAAGLMAPRYLTVAEDGSVYVTEAGAGGDEELFLPGAEGEGSPEATPEAQAPFATRGTTGQVTRIAPDGTVSVAASGLPSYLTGGLEATGPAGIVVTDGTLWVSVGGPGHGTVALFEPLPNQNSVVSIDEVTGEITQVADLQAFEIENNPDPNLVDSNIYGMGLGNDGMLYVVDAGGNTVFRVDPESGELSLLAVVPGIEIPEDMAPPGGNPARGGALELDPVPTNATANPDGGVFVSLLSGGPFPEGAAKILAIDEEGNMSDAAGGLTMCTDVKVGPDGNLYAVQISMNFMGEMPAPGNVVRIGEDGSLEVVVDGLMLPNGIAFDADGNLYIATGAVTLPGMDPAGMVLRCDGVAASM